jgi:hypothetical protein
VHDAPWSKSGEAFESIPTFEREEKRFRAIFRLVCDDERSNPKSPRGRSSDLVSGIARSREEIRIAPHLHTLTHTRLYAECVYSRRDEPRLHR